MAARRPIYLDHHSTTPVAPEVLDAMLPYFREDFGNAASESHSFGWRAAAAVDAARERLAAALGARPDEIFFTSGATESNNLAILGAARAGRRRRDHVVTVATEHPSVLDPCTQLEREGFSVTLLPVDDQGLIDLSELADILGERSALVSVMAANNEIGVLQPIEEIADLCRERGVLFHSDAAQAAGKLPLRVDRVEADLLSLSGHKIYGPKGVGALYVRRRRPRIRLEPLLFGGGHEGGLRSGTLPVPLIVGMAAALDLCLAELEGEAKRLRGLAEGLLARLQGELSGVKLNGHPDLRLPGNVNLTFEGVDGDRLLLSLADIAISSGSACSSASPKPSHVLAALGHSEALSRASLRFGLGRGTSAEDIEWAARRVIDEVRAQRSAGSP
ncbi:MAG: cysteine desulfurase [Deltaproteobacteria bacterium]|nr:cysteine desulfurase [Deltaproteobacteria bacterium]